MATINVVCLGGTYDGVTRERELELKEDGLTPIDVVFADYDVTPKIAIRPAEVEHPKENLKTQGPVVRRYVFDQWLDPRTAQFVPAT